MNKLNLRIKINKSKQELTKLMSSLPDVSDDAIPDATSNEAATQPFNLSYFELNKSDLIPSKNNNGIFNEYYFDTNTIKHIDNSFECADEKEKENDESMLFYPCYCYAKIMNNNNNVREYEYYMTVGLNSNIKQDEFKRKHLNLLILVDISGSMNGLFGNAIFDIDLKGEWRNNLQINDKIDVKDNNNLKWYNAKVIEVNNELKRVKINYIGWGNKYNEYISVNSNRIAPFNCAETKLSCTKNGIKSIIKQLTVKDRISVITFAKKAEILQKLEFINDINMNNLNNKIENMSAGHVTNFEIGYKQSIEVYKELFNDNEYELNSINYEYDNREIQHKL